MSEHHTHDLPERDASQPTNAEGSRFAKAHHILLYFLGGVALIWLLSGFYQVKADEIAIIERLGQYVAAGNGKTMQIEHGLHYRLPWPIDRVHKVSVQQTSTLRVSAFDSSPDTYADLKMALQQERWPMELISALFDPYLITADKSVIHMDISVVYRINDPEAWLNTISHSIDSVGTSDDLRQQTFQEIAQHAMINQVAHMTLEQVLFSDLAQLGSTMQAAVEKAMRIADAHEPTGFRQLGIQVQRVEIVRSRPPDRVKSAYDQVVQAKAEKQGRISTAAADFNAAQTKAQGQRDTMITEAQQYATSQTNSALGEAARFKEVFTQYVKSPMTTRFGLYADAARSVLSNARRIYRVLPGQRLMITVEPPPEYDAGQVRQGQ